MPSTARTHPEPTWKCIARSRTWSSVVPERDPRGPGAASTAEPGAGSLPLTSDLDTRCPSLAAQREARVQHARDAVADEMQPEEERHDREPRRDDDPRGGAHVALAGVQDLAPAHLVDVAEPEEAEARLGEDRVGHLQRRVRDDRREAVRDDVAEDDRQRRDARRDRSLHVAALLDSEHLRSHDLRVRWPHRERSEEHT